MRLFRLLVLMTLCCSVPVAAKTHHHAGKAPYSGGRIVGGTVAPAHSAPWQAEIYSTAVYTKQDFAADRKLVRARSSNAAYLEARGSFDVHHICGGALIAPNWVLTAAHCINDRPEGTSLDYFIKNRRIRLGTQDLTSGGSTYTIARIVIHPDWNDARSANDLALIELDPTPALDPANLAPIRMIGSNSGDPLNFDTSSIFRATGWGVTEKRGAHDPEHLDSKGKVVHDSAQLMQVQLNYVPNDRCKAVRANRGMVTARIICAGEPQGGKDTCQGDSGGPLTFDISDGINQAETVLVAVVSNGSGCALPHTPGLYTFVAPYQEWIARVTAKGSSQ